MPIKCVNILQKKTSINTYNEDSNLVENNIIQTGEVTSVSERNTMPPLSGSSTHCLDYLTPKMKTLYSPKMSVTIYH
jgi:hypothetical protein